MGEPTDESDELEPVAEFRDAARAELCRMALQAGGVEAWLSQQNLAGVAPDLGVALGIEVLVRKSESLAARELIAALQAGEASLPLEEPACPACGSTESQYLPSPKRVQAVVGMLLVGVPRPDIGWSWKCSRCGHRWQ